jgi:DNA topoisomerase-3
MAKLLETGKTPLLKSFVSNRTRKKFSAYLVRGVDGKVGFEFEVRTPRAAKAPKVAKADGAAKPAAAAKPTKAAAKKPATKRKKAAAAA